jgi:hypothetical protein
VGLLLAVIAPGETASAGSDATGGVREILAWLGVLALTIIVGWLVIIIVRRRLSAENPEESPFTLESLRELRRAGQITDAEFAQARDAMIDATRRAIARQSRATASRPEGRAESPGARSGRRSTDGRRGPGHENPR